MKILFYSDGSLQSDKAVRFGAQIAAAFQAEAAILAVIERAGREDVIRRALRRAQEICKDHHLEVEVIVREGRPGPEILKHTRETHYDLLVIGGVRQNPLWWVFDPLWKSVRAYKLIESAEPHVLVVIGSPPGLRRILVCTDGSPALDQAVEFAGRLAQALQGVVHLFHVMPKMPAIYANLVRLDENVERLLRSNSELGRTLRHQKELLKRLGVLGKMRLHHGLVVPELHKELHKYHYDLVVIGSSPVKEKLRKYIMGDITRQIINHSEVPVLVVRTGHKTFLGVAKEVLTRPFRRSDKAAGAAKE